jgi:hypothetical protein
MIAYQDLVAALTSWRERNGLPTASPDYGSSAAPRSPQAQLARRVAGEVSQPVVDVSDDSGIIIADDSAEERSLSAALDLDYETAPEQHDPYAESRSRYASEGDEYEVEADQFDDLMAEAGFDTGEPTSVAAPDDEQMIQQARQWHGHVGDDDQLEIMSEEPDDETL